ncbi:hypothetical protein QCN29_31595 [Streptomyces sp. HNM0663]|uniref:Uncharacterized protein n=1 Tax=Streptomyces chengmaiensis TaxID=3040919 RepID=A0ABT6HX09_9ACTN|nr:hypothetical protein [Streptomyces chengmaiensis]MDH2393239.1 hypothetical protein [Streptomyces chengmaiensis]
MDQHVPGCRKGVKDQDNGAHPATPPRGGVGSELLPALHQTGHGASGAGGLAGVMPDVAPERGAPQLAPPSPMELSILRV